MTASENSTPITTVTGSFTDSDYGAFRNPVASAYNAIINWGNGTISTGTVSSQGQGVFNVTGNHIYATNGTHSISMTIIDTAGAAAAVSTTFTGGLELESNGDLRDYNGSSNPILDSGVESYLVRNADSTVFTLHTDGNLFANFSSQSIGSNIQTILLGPDGTLYALDDQGNLETAATGSTTLQLSESNVQTILEDNSGNLWRLDTDGDLLVLYAGSSTWTSPDPFAPLFQSISLNADGSAINAVDTNGDLWVNGNYLLAGPHFSLNVPANATAGQSISVTVTVLDALGDPVPGYTGTVQLATSNAAAGPPLDHTFTAADAGSYTFNVTLQKTGNQTITATDISGVRPLPFVEATAAEATVAVSPIPASSLKVLLPGA
jgi:hypothetical protein